MVITSIHWCCSSQLNKYSELFWFDNFIGKASRNGLHWYVCAPQDQFLDTRMVLTTCLASCNTASASVRSFRALFGLVSHKIRSKRQCDSIYYSPAGCVFVSKVLFSLCASISCLWHPGSTPPTCRRVSVIFGNCMVLWRIPRKIHLCFLYTSYAVQTEPYSNPIAPPEHDIGAAAAQNKLVCEIVFFFKQ